MKKNAYAAFACLLCVVVLTSCGIFGSDKDDSINGNNGDWPSDTETEVVDVTNPETCRTWMDRNLGASRVATGPMSSEISHQANPLRPLLCAKPALISESVPHPAAYGVGSFIITDCYGYWLIEPGTLTAQVFTDMNLSRRQLCCVKTADKTAATHPLKYQTYTGITKGIAETAYGML